MAATKDQKRRRTTRASRGVDPGPARSATASPLDGQAAAGQGGGSVAPPQVKTREAVHRIRAVADRSESLDARHRLRRLARLVAGNPKSVHKVGLVEAAISECLEQASTAGRETREPWLEREAATWALAWLARSRRAGGSAGAILEQLVREGRAGVATVESRDTIPAPFVLTLGRLFPDIEACAELGGRALEALEKEIGRLVSAGGAVGLTGSTAVLERVTRWALCREVLAGGWSAATEELFMAAITSAVRLLGGKGRMLVGPGKMPRLFSQPILAAAQSRRAPGRLRRTATLIADGAVPRHAKSLLPRDMHEPAAAVAILRSGWDADALRVVVEYRDAVPRLEIAIGDRLLVDGPWQWEVTRDGERLEAEGPWTHLGLETDRKATFFEIAAPLSGGLRLERAVVVIPADRVVVLADSITRSGGAAAALRHTSVVSLAPGLEAEQADETREVMLFDTSVRCMALPLGLPEWKTADGGAFTAAADRLTLEQHGLGRMHAPLWLDCDPRRLGGQVTWRHLTVADTRQNIPRSMAAGYRVQVGLDQWLLYRALDEPRNRTLLGCNVSCEFLLGRIGRSGMVRRMAEIQ